MYKVIPGRDRDTADNETMTATMHLNENTRALLCRRKKSRFAIGSCSISNQSYQRTTQICWIKLRDDDCILFFVRILHIRQRTVSGLWKKFGSLILLEEFIEREAGSHPTFRSFDALRQFMEKKRPNENLPVRQHVAQSVSTQVNYECME
jgi:hypothetical protein